jgi:soluble lytic murein transglycosylase-like protein
LNPASRPASGDGERGSGLQSFVPPNLEPIIATAAQRWNVSGELLAAQLYAESNFNPFAESGAGAQGIAQFMPGTAQAYGLSNPFDSATSIEAQAHLMRDLLRQFASVPLALAAYNAGAGRVSACGCIPPIPETQAYVAKILGLMGGAGEGFGVLEVRLVE